MRRVEEFEATKLNEGNVPASQLDLKRAAVMRRSEQHRLLLQIGADLPVLQHSLSDITRLHRLVANADQFGALGGPTVGPEVLGETLTRKIDHTIRRGEDRLGGSIVSIQRDDLRHRAELTREVQDISHRRSPKRIDRLRIVTDYR